MYHILMCKPRDNLKKSVLGIQLRSSSLVGSAFTHGHRFYALNFLITLMIIAWKIKAGQGDFTQVLQHEAVTFDL